MPKKTTTTTNKSRNEIQDEDARQNDNNKDNYQYHQGQVDTIRTVMNLLEKSETRQYKEGLRERNFALGVLNCFVVAYVFGRYPQHFWLLYLVEALVLLPLRWYQCWTSQPMNQVLYLVDYCWISNFMGCLLLVLLIVDGKDLSTSLLDSQLRQEIYMSLVGIGIGPLLGANYLLPFVAFRFHDLVYMASVFIHLMPPMVMYTLLWHCDDISNAWPTVFHLDCQPDPPIQYFPTINNNSNTNSNNNLGSIAGNTFLFYWLWFLPYVSFMVLIGLKLPQQQATTTSSIRLFDTVFHSSLRGGLCMALGTYLWNRPTHISQEQINTNTFEMRDFIVYMTIHAILTNSAILIPAYFCYSYRLVHATVLWFMVVVCVSRGATTYKKWASRTAWLIENEFQTIIQEINTIHTQQQQ